MRLRWRVMGRWRVVGVSVVAIVISPALADTICVPDDHDTIQAAIDAAADGDEICVAPGTYPEAIDLLGKGAQGSGR